MGKKLFFETAPVKAGVNRGAAKCRSYMGYIPTREYPVLSTVLSRAVGEALRFRVSWEGGTLLVAGFNSSPTILGSLVEPIFGPPAGWTETVGAWCAGPDKAAHLFGLLDAAEEALRRGFKEGLDDEPLVWLREGPDGLERLLEEPLFDRGVVSRGGWTALRLSGKRFLGVKFELAQDLRPVAGLVDAEADCWLPLGGPLGALVAFTAALDEATMEVAFAVARVLGRTFDGRPCGR